MGEFEEKERHSTRRKRNIIKEALWDNKGPFKLKVIDNRKQEYKRIKLDKRNIHNDLVDE